MWPHSSQAGASPIISLRTSWTVSTLASAFSTGAVSTFCTGAVSTFSTGAVWVVCWVFSPQLHPPSWQLHPEYLAFVSAGGTWTISVLFRYSSPNALKT